MPKLDPGPGGDLVDDHGARALASHLHEPAIEAVEPGSVPGGGHAADPIVVGRGAPQRERRRRGKAGKDDVAVVVDGRGGGRIEGRERPAAGDSFGMDTWRAATSNPAGAHGSSPAVSQRVVR